MMPNWSGSFQTVGPVMRVNNGSVANKRAIKMIQEDKKEGEQEASKDGNQLLNEGLDILTNSNLNNLTNKKMIKQQIQDLNDKSRLLFVESVGEENQNTQEKIKQSDSVFPAVESNGIKKIENKTLRNQPENDQITFQICQGQEDKAQKLSKQQSFATQNIKKQQKPLQQDDPANDGDNEQQSESDDDDDHDELFKNTFAKKQSNATSNSKSRVLGHNYKNQKSKQVPILINPDDINGSSYKINGIQQKGSIQDLVNQNLASQALSVENQGQRHHNQSESNKQNSIEIDQQKQQEYSESLSEQDELQNLSDDIEEQGEFNANDSIVCLYTAVNRTNSRYKCSFINCIVQIGDKEMIIPKIQADIDY